MTVESNAAQDLNAEFREYNANCYLPKTFEYQLAVEDAGEGPYVTIDGAEMPLMEDAFSMGLIQPGSVQRNQKLAKYVGKIRVKVSEDKDAVDSDLYFDEVLLLPIAVIGHYRSKFLRFDRNSTDNTPVCYSTNGVTPSPKCAEPVCAVCARVERNGGKFKMVPVCPDATWGKNGEKPECSMTTRMAFLKMDDLVPVVMDFRGAGASALTQLDRESKKVRNICRLRKKSTARYIIKMTVENMGTYVKPVLSFTEAPEQYADINAYKGVAAYYKDTLFTRRVAEAETAEATETATSEDKENAHDAELLAKAEAQAESFDI